MEPEHRETPAVKEPEAPRRAVAGELAVLRYAFTGWRTSIPNPPGGDAFTGHRRNASSKIQQSVKAPPMLIERSVGAAA